MKSLPENSSPDPADPRRRRSESRHGRPDPSAAANPNPSAADGGEEFGIAAQVHSGNHSSSHFDPDGASLAAEEAAHRACRQYEHQLRNCQAASIKKPSIESIVSDIHEPLRPLALYELVKLDVEHRRARGEHPNSADYNLKVDCANARRVIFAAFETLADAPSPTSRDGQQDGSTSAPIQPPRKMPRKLGRYELAGQLGRGGMGTVFKAFDSRLKRYVALKVPHFNEAGDALIRERFRREALALAALRHDLIVAVHDVEQADDYEFMTMALIEGEPLRRYVNATHPLLGRHAATIVRALATAMQYVHDRGVIHRDLKPENVILEGGRRPIIVDFGLARTPGAGDARGAAVAQDLGMHVTRFGQVAGTPEYSAPEQLAGDFDAIGPQADIYSLGVILFELLTGRLPWHDDESKPEPGAVQPLQLLASDLNSEVDPLLGTICEQAMAVDQADRFQSMGEFAKALEPFCRPPRDSAQGRDSNVGADANADASLVLQEIARQATSRVSRTTPKKSASRRPTSGLVAGTAAAILAVAAVAIAYHRGLIFRPAASPPVAYSGPHSTPALGPTNPRESRPARPSLLDGAFAKVEASYAAERQKNSSDTSDADDRPTPAASDAAAIEARAKQPGGGQIAAPPSKAPPSQAPSGHDWRQSAKQFLNSGGVITYAIATEGASNEGDQQRTQSVRTVDELATQPGSQIVGLSLTGDDGQLARAPKLGKMLAAARPTLRQLELTRVQLDEPTILAIAELSELEELTLRGIVADGPIWLPLSGGSFPSLTRVDLGENGLSPSDLDLLLAAFKQSESPLQDLTLHNAIGVGKQQFEQIAEFSSLVALDLSDAEIEPAELGRLSRLPKLARLSLSGIRLEGADLRALEGLEPLQFVNLARTDLTDQALPDLMRTIQKLRRLETIDLGGSRLSSLGVLKLSRRLAKRDVDVAIEARDRLDFGFRTGARRAAALDHYGADAGVEPAIDAGIEWLCHNQAVDGTWSLVGPDQDETIQENQIVATALALLALQGNGYDGLGKDKVNNSVRHGYHGLGKLIHQAGDDKKPGPYGNALAALAVCDLHAMAGDEIGENSRLPQDSVVEIIIRRSGELQQKDGGWSDSNRSNGLLTAWYVQTLSSASAAGFDVDAESLLRARQFLDGLWMGDEGRYVFRSRDRQSFKLSGHAAATTALDLLDAPVGQAARTMIHDNYAQAANNPFLSYYGTRIAVNAGGDMWKFWNHNHITKGLLAARVQEGPEQGSWAPSVVSDLQDAGGEHACGRLEATCLHLLALESFFRHLPRSAPEAWRTVVAGDSGL